MIKRYCLAVLFIIILTNCSERNIIVDYDVESPLIANDISNQKIINSVNCIILSILH